MELPPVEDILFWEEIESYEREQNMPHVTSIEKRGHAKMLLRALERRFRVPVPEELAARIRETSELSLLDQWLDWAYEAKSLDEFLQRISDTAGRNVNFR